MSRDAASHDAPPLPAAESAEEQSSGLRQMMEAIVCLAIAVILFRTFQVEGYLISTGSMAPSLLGYHKRVTCPTCRSQFAFGVAYDDDAEALARVSGQDELDLPGRSYYGGRLAACPNCGQDSIDIRSVPRNEGDQLLVHKQRYTFQRPRRWEIVVFRNPTKPSQAYVKRLVGLPGEAVQIVRGDIYANGRIQRKDLATQRGMRILVYDHDCRPNSDPDWQDRLVAQPGESGWRAEGSRFVLDAASPRITKDAQPAAGVFAWVTYRHWIRSGGLHKTAVALDSWPAGVSLPDGFFNPLHYDAEAGQLSCTGVLPAAVRERLLNGRPSGPLARALEELSHQSHFAPVTDQYGYNGDSGTASHIGIRDSMLAAEVTIHDGQGQFVLQMTDGRHVFDCVFDVASQQVQLFVDRSAEDAPIPRPPVLTAPLPRRFGKASLVEMSLFDRQVLLAADGALVFEPWAYDEVDDPAPAPSRPARFGARGLRVEVGGLKLYRDVYYTRGRGLHGVDEPYQLDDDEYFALGDNSPVSRDSRSWGHPVVHERLLLGKPFFLHLPSKQGKIKIGRREMHFRIPDFSRIRYIR